MTEEELRARLLAEAGKVINDRLPDKPATSQMRLADIERWVQRTGQAVQAGLLQELAQASQEAQSGEAPRCEGCRSVMQRRGLGPRRVVSEVGELRQRRLYYV